MSRLLLFYRLMVRPVLREPVRTTLTVLAIALGVAVVLAIDLAGTAAAGSFRSSMETLAGDNELEVATSGGVPESMVGILSTLPYSIRVSRRSGNTFDIPARSAEAARRVESSDGVENSALPPKRSRRSDVRRK